MSVALVEFELINETPLLLGGYDTQCHPWDAFRTQSLKGLWRWWLRAYIAGALYELGMLRNNNDLNEVVKKTSSILGSTEGASKFKIEASIENAGSIMTCGKGSTGVVCSLPRVRLLTLSKPVTYFDKGSIKVKLTIKGRLGVRIDNNEVKAALGSLLTALALNGLGKMGRRGLGTFKVRLLGGTARNVLQQYFGRDGYFDLSKIGDLINDTLEACKNLVKGAAQAGGPTTTIPLMDLISRASVPIGGVKLDSFENNTPKIVRGTSLSVFSVYEITWDRNRRNSLQALEDLQNFFFRPGRIQKFYGCRGRNCQTPYGNWEDFITYNKFSWILGLPRMQKGTGYNVNIDRIDRRASPIHLAVHEDRAFITIFVSQDWPGSVEWRGGHGRRTIRIGVNEIIRAIVGVASYLEAYLKKLGYSVNRVV